MFAVTGAEVPGQCHEQLAQTLNVSLFKNALVSIDLNIERASNPPPLAPLTYSDVIIERE